MTFRLKTIAYTADGRRIVREQDIAKDQLRVGRSAENDIHLPDLVVEPVHATITRQSGNRVQIDATGTLGFGLDAQNSRSATIDARTGAELRFGGTRISVGLEAGGPDGQSIVLLTVEAVRPDESKNSAEKDGLSLAAVMPAKRTLSWIVAGLILALFLALPIFSHFTRPAVAGPNQVIGDSSWSPGKLSRAHHQLEGKCEACHVKAFVSVRDETCVSCHKTLHDHAPAGRLAVSRAQPGLGGQVLQGVAHAFGKPGPGACVDCHTEHEGMNRIEPPRQQFCADCHGTLKDRLTDTRLGNAADFGTSHPEFSPLIMTDPVAKTMRRLPLDTAPREHSGLAFPHKVHLDPRGGVAKMAASLAATNGYGTSGMACADCHRPSENGVRFKPVVMERDCEACHSLVYDKVGPTFRKLRHGDVDQLVADLSVAGANTHFVVTGRSRPGQYAADHVYYANFAAPVGSAGLVRRALARDGVCGECHTATLINGRPAIVPVTLPDRYMAHGWFDHAAHKQTSCTACHAAPASTTATDVLLPKLAECRTCHLGEDAGKGKVPSSCAMCHSYHPAGSAPLLTRRDQR